MRAKPSKVREILAEGLRRGAKGPVHRQNAFRWMRQQMRSGAAIEEVRSAVARDPVVSQFPRKRRDYGPFIRQFPVASRYLVLKDVTQVAAGDDSSVYRTEFTQGAGWLLGWRATTVADGDVTGQASMGVMCNINGNEPLITNGEAEDFALFATLFPPNGDTWSPLMLPVDIKDVLRTSFRNYSSMNSYTPHVVWAFKDGVDPSWLVGE